MKCTNCGGPLDPGVTTCPYCNVRHEVDLRDIPFSDLSGETEMICPRCDIPLEVISIQINEGLRIERCAHCQGMFFNPGELEYLLEHSVQNILGIDRDRLNALNQEYTPHPDSGRYIKCPVCRDLMTFFNYGTQSGVIFDSCKPHGIWLDGGELRRLQEWKKAGGALLNEEREAEERQYRAKETARAEKRASAPVPDTHLGQFQRRTYEDDGLADLVLSAIRFLLK